MTHPQTTLTYTLLITHKTHICTIETQILIKNQNIDNESMNQRKTNWIKERWIDSKL